MWLIAKKSSLQSGYTLVELMIGMALGIALVAMVIPAFLNNISAFSSVTAVSRTHENARFALTELSKSIRSTGFRGCDSGTTDITNLTGNTLYDFTQGIAGVERQASETIAGIDTTNVTVKAATDAITVKSLKSVNAVIASDVPPSATTITLTAGHSVATGDIIFVGDCEKGFMFAVSGVSTNTLTLSQAVPSNAAFPDGVMVYHFDTVTYFLASSQLYTNNQGAIPTALWRKVNDSAEQELVAGIEDLQVSYGVDTDSDGIPNQFVNGTGVGADFSVVAIVRFKVVASSLDALPQEGVLQKAFSMSVNLRNSFAG